MDIERWLYEVFWIGRMKQNCMHCICLFISFLFFFIFPSFCMYCLKLLDGHMNISYEEAWNSNSYKQNIQDTQKKSPNKRKWNFNFTFFFPNLGTEYFVFVFSWKSFFMERWASNWCYTLSLKTLIPVKIPFSTNNTNTRIYGKQ